MTDEKEVDLSAETGQPEESADVSQEPQADAGSPDSASDATPPETNDAENQAGDSAEAEFDMPDLGDGEGQVVNEGDASEEDAEAAMLKMLEDLPETDDRPSADDINFGSASASKAEFQQLQEPVSSSTPRNIDLLMDVDLPIAIELGRTKMTIADILSLGPGSVVELNKLAGEPVDLLVNHKVVAKGEVVVVDENFGLRITQLMTPEERLKALAED